jgi:hypothetical protein
MRKVRNFRLEWLPSTGKRCACGRARLALLHLQIKHQTEWTQASPKGLVNVNGTTL